jgi:signal transduction histidine kinase
MPDRLVDLYERIANKVARVDGPMKAALGASDLAREWEDLTGLVAQQKDMLGEIARRTQELSSLSAFLQMHSEREKASLARELHDELGGILTPAKMDLAWLQSSLGSNPDYGMRLERLSELIDKGIDLKRRVIEELHPSLLDHLGLSAALTWYVDETCRAANIACRVDIPAKLERLSPDLEIALYRIVQESVTNAVRHARATHLEVTFERTREGLRIVVADNGIGIADLESARRFAHGLAGMSQRMRAISGTLDVRSGTGSGTRVEAFLPLAA